MKFYRYLNGEDSNGVYIYLEVFYLVKDAPNSFMVSRDPSNKRGLLRVPKDPTRCRKIFHSKDDAWRWFLLNQQIRIWKHKHQIRISEQSIEYIKTNPPMVDFIEYITKPQ